MTVSNWRALRKDILAGTGNSHAVRSAWSTCLVLESVVLESVVLEPDSVGLGTAGRLG